MELEIAGPASVSRREPALRHAVGRPSSRPSAGSIPGASRRPWNGRAPAAPCASTSVRGSSATTGTSTPTCRKRSRFSTGTSGARRPAGRSWARTVPLRFAGGETVFPDLSFRNGAGAVLHLELFPPLARGRSGAAARTACGRARSAAGAGRGPGRRGQARGRGRPRGLPLVRAARIPLPGLSHRRADPGQPRALSRRERADSMPSATHGSPARKAIGRSPCNSMRWGRILTQSRRDAKQRKGEKLGMGGEGRKCERERGPTVHFRPFPPSSSAPRRCRPVVLGVNRGRQGARQGLLA